MNSRKIIPNVKFFEEVRAILAQARQKVYAAVNFAMVELRPRADSFVG
jgi:hypothetical protein